MNGRVINLHQMCGYAFSGKNIDFKFKNVNYKKRKDARKKRKMKRERVTNSHLRVQRRKAKTTFNLYLNILYTMY